MFTLRALPSGSSKIETLPRSQATPTASQQQTNNKHTPHTVTMSKTPGGQQASDKFMKREAQSTFMPNLPLPRVCLIRGRAWRGSSKCTRAHRRSQAWRSTSGFRLWQHECRRRKRCHKLAGREGYQGRASQLRAGCCEQLPENVRGVVMVCYLNIGL